MCMEDIRLGRKTKSILTPFTLGALAVNAVIADKKRTRLIFHPPSAGSYSFSNLIGLTLASGINISTSGRPIVMTVEEYGDLVTKDWYIIGDGVATIAVIVEGHLAAE